VIVCSEFMCAYKENDEHETDKRIMCEGSLELKELTKKNGKKIKTKKTRKLIGTKP